MIEQALSWFKLRTKISKSDIFKQYGKVAITALEKQIPKKTIDTEREYDGYYGICPNCRNVVNDDRDFRYCNMCGQSLDWSDTE